MLPQTFTLSENLYLILRGHNLFLVVEFKVYDWLYTEKPFSIKGNRWHIKPTTQKGRTLYKQDIKVNTTGINVLKEGNRFKILNNSLVS